MDVIASSDSAIIGSVALKVLLNGCATDWSPRDLNIATPRNRAQDFIQILHKMHYNVNRTGVQSNRVTGAISHLEYVNLEGMMITLTESKESDSFLGIVMGSNHTASMNFITNEHFVCLYPIQTLRQHITYAYQYPLESITKTTMSSRGFTTVTASISHANLCCPNAQRQLETLKGIGLLVWCVADRPSNLLTKSYSWRLGEICLDAHCTIKTVSRQLKRRTSLRYETDDEGSEED